MAGHWGAMAGSSGTTFKVALPLSIIQVQMGTCTAENENLLKFYTPAPQGPHLSHTSPNASPESYTHGLE